MASSILSLLQSYLPSDKGLLPTWLLFISIVSIGNSVQAYCTLSYTTRVYNGSSSWRKNPASWQSPVTPLSARTFGTWTAIQSLVRIFAAYHISNAAFYQLGFCTFIVAFGHFISEWLFFKTTSWGPGLAGPVIVSSGTIVWMYMQWDYYAN